MTVEPRHPSCRALSWVVVAVTFAACASRGGGAEGSLRCASAPATCAPGVCSAL